MRALTTQELAVLSAPGFSARTRVRIEVGGVLRDMTALDLGGGNDFVRSIRRSVHVDQDFAVARISLHRQVDRWNLSPFVATSKLNNIDGTFLQPGRTVVIEGYLLPAGQSPASGDWREVFRGRLGPVEENGDTLDVSAFDLAHELADAQRFLEVERTYGSIPGTNIQLVLQQLLDDAHGQPWQASRAYRLGERVRPTTTNGHWYEVTTVGTSGGSEPGAWTTTIGATVISGGAVFTCRAAIPQLYTPSIPTWLIRAGTQKRMPVWQAMKALVAQLGWELRSVYDASTTSWRLTLREPPRTKTVPDFTWHPNTTDSAGAFVPSFLTNPMAQHGVQDVRNDIEGTYSDPADLDAAGNPKRKTVQRNNAASITAYGRRWMAVAEGATSQINTQTEMERLLDNLLLDLKDPFYTRDVVLPYFYAAELGDLYRFKADGYTTTSDLDLAVVGIEDEQDESGAARTRLTVRGKPSGGFQRWREMFDGGALVKRSGPSVGPGAPTGLSYSRVVGGVTIYFYPPVGGTPPARYEVHVSKISGFAISALTLACVVPGDGDSANLIDLDKATTYYCRVVPFDAAGNQGTASAELAALTGAVSTQNTLTPEAGNLIPNGTSEAGAAAVGLDPEGNGLVNDPTNAKEGSWCRRFQLKATQDHIVFGSVRAVPGEEFAFEAWVKSSVALTTSRGIHIAIVSYDAGGGWLSGGYLNVRPELTTSYQKFTVRGVAQPGAVRVDFLLDTHADGVNVGDFIYLDGLLAQRAVRGVAQGANVSPGAMLNRAFSEMPANGGFEAWPDHETMPESWTALSGSFTRETSSTYVRAGRYALKAASAVSAAHAVSDLFPVNKGWAYEVAVAYSRGGAAGSSSDKIGIRWYDSAGNYISTFDRNPDALADDSKAVIRLWATAPSNAQYGAVSLYKHATGYDMWFDSASVRVAPVVVDGRLEATQTINNVTATRVNWTEYADSWGAFTGGTSHVFTVPAGRAGRYLIEASVLWAGGTSANSLRLEVYKNGTFTASLARDFAIAPTFQHGGCVVMDLTDGDTIYVIAYQDTGASRNLDGDARYSRMTITRLDKD